MNKILVIDDDTYICNLLVHYLNQNGFKAHACFSGSEARKKLKSIHFQLILCDYRLPDVNGLDLFHYIKKKHPGIPVIIMTAYADVEIAVKLIKAGAIDYVTKPVQHEEILQQIKQAIEDNKNKPSSHFQNDFITGKSKEIQEVLEHAKIVAPTELSVLIEGETGVGKEYIARYIHFQSNRKNKPFVAVDCGALPKELANSELFGHVKGAFTGAVSDKKGYFEQANGGTLFLDEIGNLSYDNQIKLLRAIQEKAINLIGDNKTISVDIRLIVASNDDLLFLVNDNSFRDDLFHRINGFKIIIPPLRERQDDMLIFINHFISKANAAFDKKVIGINDEVLHLFNNYHWYGNIRELQNVINRSVLLTKSNEITADVLPDEIKHQSSAATGIDMRKIPDNSRVSDLKEATSVTEKEIITNALRKSKYNKSKAAKLLNIDRKTLYNKIKQLNIEGN